MAVYSQWQSASDEHWARPLAREAVNRPLTDQPELGAVYDLSIRPLEQGEDGHCMAVAQLEIRLQPLDDGSRFHAWGEFAVLRKPLFLRKRAKVGGTLARLRLNVGKISLE